MREHEELAADLDECADSCVLAEKHNWAQHMRRAAALLRQPAPKRVVLPEEPPAWLLPPGDRRADLAKLVRHVWSAARAEVERWPETYSRRRRAEEAARLCTEAGIDLKSPDAQRLVRDARDGMPLHDVLDLIKHWNATITTENHGTD